jgi:type I restriction enzyme S subunit
MTTGFCLFLNAGNVTSKGFNFEDNLYITEEKSDSMRAGKLNRGDIVFTTRGTVGNFALYSNEIPIKHMRINSGKVILRGNTSYSIQYVYHLCCSTSFKQDIINYLSGSAQPQLPIKDFNRIPIVIPVIDKLKVFSEKSCVVNKNIDILKNENSKLAELQSLLLAKMGQIH